MKTLVLLAILISSLTSGKTAPSEAYLAGEWGCTGSRFVFMANEGPTPDNRTMEFRTSVGIITIKGFLVQENGKLILAYKRSDLFMIMQYLCSPQGRKNISPLGKLLDSTKGLTLAMEFEKN